MHMSGMDLFAPLHFNIELAKSMIKNFQHVLERRLSGIFIHEIWGITRASSWQDLTANDVLFDVMLFNKEIQSTASIQPAKQWTPPCSKHKFKANPLCKINWRVEIEFYGVRVVAFFKGFPDIHQQSERRNKGKYFKASNRCGWVFAKQRSNFSRASSRMLYMRRVEHSECQWNIIKPFMFKLVYEHLPFKHRNEETAFSVLNSFIFREW